MSRLEAAEQAAADKCEACGVMNGETIQRAKDGSVWRYVNAPWLCFHISPGGYHFRADVIGCGWLPPIKVILTVAHLNHDPTDNRMENLRHWCQKCHNSYDAAHRAANRKRRLTESKPPG